MDKFVLVVFLGLLMMANARVESYLVDNLATLGELENLHVEEGEDVDLFDAPSWTSEEVGKVLVNVDSFGAAGNGVSDDTQAFQKAWKQACSTQKSVLLVPPGRSYLVNATRFYGPCADNLVVQIDGTIIAPNDPKNWDPKNQRLWLSFSNLTGVTFQGSGHIEGSGALWWAASCKKNKSNPCVGAPTALTISSSSNVRMKGLTIRNSQQMHFVISHCNVVRISKMLVSAPGDSPNTDGIHLTQSTNIVVEDTKIGTGDDCISIVDGCSNIRIKNVNCGPGHGISIGSLGKDNSVGIVTKVVVDTAVLRGTTNGLRIKTWQGGSGHVNAVRYDNVVMEDVANPIIIDQFYCDSPTSCKNQTAAVQISQVMYRNISGTTKSTKAMKFDCSDTVPCTKIVLSNISLENQNGSVETYCHSATGIGLGVVKPSADCLASAGKDFCTKETEHVELAKAGMEDPGHSDEL
ncbi:probable polygalacturonase At1g80170 [Malania oleifera]|uniref:probable polygalacturonase At1g80170 n=1 Tax=Malania oleifera TaxID=397392 RepID=UPI0025AEC4EF|nr:probable polygalacturonase At1g80170 [Malania oleifera]